MDLKKQSVVQLKKLSTKIDKEIARRDGSKREALFKEVQKLAKAAGVRVGDLLGSKKPVGRRAPKDVRAKPRPKYQNPNDVRQTWTGRGRQPHWVKAWIAGGRSLDGLLIK